MRRFLTVFSLSAGLAVTSAQAEDTSEFLDGLAIPDNPAYTGIGALEKLFGRYMRLDHGSFTATYRFSPDSTLVAKLGPPSNETLTGTWRTDGDQTCMTVGGTQEFCGVTRIENDLATFAGPDGQVLKAEVYDLEPPPLMAVKGAPLDTAFCETISSIADEEPYGFESLIDDSFAQERLGPLLEPFWFGKLELWGDDCRVEKSLATGSAVYNCQRVFNASDDQSASIFFQENLQQVELCLLDRTEASDHDYQFKSGLGHSFVGDGRATVLKLKGGTNVSLSQTTNSVCRGDNLFDCDQVYGVWLSVAADLLADRQQ